MRPVITACLLAGVTLLIYSVRLTTAPQSIQESQVLDQGQSGTGPLFFHAGGDQWLQPLPVYATSVAQAMGGGVSSARMVTVLVASLNVGLIFLCTRRLLAGRLAPFVASLLLLATPAHIIFARSGTDAVLSIPFVLLWLLAMTRFWTVDSTASIVAAGAALGAGIYSNRAAPLTMGFLLLISIAALISGGRRWRPVVILSSAFGAFLIPAAVWFAINPATYPDTFGRWVAHLAHIRNPIEGLRAFVNWNTLGNRASLYWGFLDPAWLFFDNMLLLVMLPLLVIGLVSWRRALPRHAMILLAGGAAVAPFAGSSFGVPHYAADALTFLPFATLLMTAGATRIQQRFS